MFTLQINMIIFLSVIFSPKKQFIEKYPKIDWICITCTIYTVHFRETLVIKLWKCKGLLNTKYRKLDQFLCKYFIFSMLIKNHCFWQDPCEILIILFEGKYFIFHSLKIFSVLRDQTFLYDVSLFSIYESWFSFLANDEDFQYEGKFFSVQKILIHYLLNRYLQSTLPLFSLSINTGLPQGLSFCL
jgi:hypothetical protein